MDNEETTESDEAARPVSRATMLNMVCEIAREDATLLRALSGPALPEEGDQQK